MKKNTVQYTVRDVPEELDLVLRESAALEEVSLNQATLRAIQRGLGVGSEPVRYRSLKNLIPRLPKPSVGEWRDVLNKQDKTHPEDWK
jgi:hypothetical protein